MVICLERGADLHSAQLMPLPLTVSCFSKIQIGFTFLVLAHPGSPGKGPLNACLCVGRKTTTHSVVRVVCGSGADEASAAAAPDPVDMLDKDKCIQLLAELRHAKWFQVLYTSCHVASLRAGLTLVIYWAGHRG